MMQLQKSIEIEAHRNRVWEQLSALDEISRWASAVGEAQYSSSVRQGVGAQRLSQMKGVGRLHENVVEWNNHDHHFAYTVAGIPLVAYMKNTWRVQPSGENSSTVSLQSEFRAGFGPLGRLLESRLLRGRVEAAMERLLAELKYYLEHGEAANAQQQDHLPLAAVRST